MSPGRAAVLSAGVTAGVAFGAFALLEIVRYRRAMGRALARFREDLARVEGEAPAWDRLARMTREQEG